MYCPKIYSSNDNYKNNVDVKVYYYDGKLMIVPNNYGSYHWFYGIKDEAEEVNVKEIGVNRNLTIRFTTQEEEPTYTDINADYPKILGKSTLPGVY